MHWPMLAAVGVVLLVVAAQAQPAPPTSGRQTNGSALSQLRGRMKQLQEIQAQELAGRIGPPPAGCAAVLSYADPDELSEGLAEFVADVLNRAYWNVQRSSNDALACATPPRGGDSPLRPDQGRVGPPLLPSGDGRTRLCFLSGGPGYTTAGRAYVNAPIQPLTSAETIGVPRPVT